MQGSYPGSGKPPKIGKKEYNRLSHQILTDFPRLPAGDKRYPYENRNHFYVFSVNGPGSYSFYCRMKIVGNEERIARIREGLKNGTF